MDEIVKAALAKWPNVPHCYGWLGLDARGNWFMRDDAAQAAGAFDSQLPRSKGSLLKHEKLIDFIGRNYLCDAAGQWFFQNGPQRVYLELEATPYIWRVADDGSVRAHTGALAQVQRSVVDEQGHLYLEADIGFGLVHTQDMLAASNAVEQGMWLPQQVRARDLPTCFAFVKSPAALQASRGGPKG